MSIALTQRPIVKFKVIPSPPTSLAVVGEMQAAVPLVPDREESCCARLMSRTDVSAQDRAKEWLTFLRALELVEEVDGGYRRLPADPDPAGMRAAFRERLYLVDDVLAVLEDADGPLDHEAVFERVKGRLPQWERLRHGDPEAVWRERVWRLLEWAVLLDLAARRNGGYVVS